VSVPSRTRSLAVALATLLVAAVASPARADVRDGLPVELRAPAVESLVERALERAPSLAARRERVQAAQTAVQAADALPAPMIAFQYQSFNFPSYTIGSDPGSMAGASISQGLLSGGRRTARKQVAQAEADQRAAEQRVVAADLATEVRLQYARLYAIDREREALADAAQLARMIERTASARYAAGESDQATLLRILVEQTRIGQRVADVLAERTMVQAVLNRLTNDPPDTPIGGVTELPPAALPAAAAGLVEQAAQQAPAIAVRKSEVGLAGRKVDEARADLKPAWTVGGGFYWQGGFDRLVNFTVGVELPLWTRHKREPLVAAAEGEKRAAELEVASAAADVRAQAASLLAEYRNALDQIQRYEGGLLPQNSAALDATRASYLGGRGDFVSVLDEFRRWVDLRAELAVRVAERYAAQVRLAALLESPGGIGAQ